MKEYEITYLGIEDGEKMQMVGSGHGFNGQDAVRDFLFWHTDVIKILKVRFYREYQVA